MTAVLQDDIGAFLIGYIRREIRLPEMLAKYPVLEGFEVTNVEPDEDAGSFPEKLIVVRDDGTTPTELVTGESDVGVSVLMGSPQLTADSSLAARVVHAIVRDCARVEAGNPVSYVGQSNGPYLVPEDQPRARWYSTHTLSTVGESL